MKTKKILSCILALTMVFSMSVTAFATQDAALGSETTVPVELYVNAATFSVTVPSKLPITVDANGGVVVATDAKIVNNSQGKVEVKDLTVTASEDWSLAAMSSDFANMPVNSKTLGMSFNGKDVTEGELASTFAVIDANSEQEFEYAAKLAPQANSIEGVDVASAVFTIGWKTGEEPVEKLLTFRLVNTATSETKTYQAEEGMTWREWIASDYNDGSFTIVEAEDPIPSYVYYNGNQLGYDADHEIVGGDIDFYINGPSTDGSFNIITEVNGKTSSDITYDYDLSQSRNIQFTYKGDGEVAGWEFVGVVEDVDYAIADEGSNYIVITVSDNYDGELIVNAIIE